MWRKPATRRGNLPGRNGLGVPAGLDPGKQGREVSESKTTTAHSCHYTPEKEGTSTLTGQERWRWRVRVREIGEGDTMCPHEQCSCRALGTGQPVQGATTRRKSGVFSTRPPLPAPARWPSAEPAPRAGPRVAALAAAGPRRPSRVLLPRAARQRGDGDWRAGPSAQGSVSGDSLMGKRQSRTTCSSDLNSLL